MKQRALTICLCVGIAGGLAGTEACGDSGVQPVRPSDPSSIAVFPIALSISGNTSLTAIGETSQLTATVTNSDNTTANVSSAVQWTSADTRVATVSSSGLLTATALGVTALRTSYRSSSRFVETTARITVTPPGTFIASGRVREPGSGSIGGVRVLEAASGAFTMSDGDGEYSLGGLTTTRLTFEKEGYESVTFDVTRNGSDTVPLQRVIRIVPGETATVTLAPNDMRYAVAPDTICGPCRMIRVTGSQAGTLQVRLAWVETHTALSLWVDGRRFGGTAVGPSEIAADVPLVPGDFLLYVGLTTGSQVYVPFTLNAR